MRFRSETLTVEKIFSYENVIPAEHIKKTRNGEYYAAEVSAGGSEPFGLYITDEVDGWIRLVWMKLFDKDVTTEDKALFIRSCIRSERKRRAGEKKGAFAEMMPDEIMEDSHEAFALAGMDVREELGNNYEFTLSQVDHRDMLESAAKKIPCKPLSEVDEVLQDTVERLMQNDERPVPIPTFVDYDRYDQDVSGVCLIKDQPKGAILVTETGGYLVIEAIYATGKNALPALLGHAFIKAMEKFGADKQVLAPVVVFKSEQIIEEMVAGEKREKILVAVQRF